MTKINAIKNAVIFTVNSDDEIIENGTIVWDGNTITQIGKTEDISIPDHADVIDAKGKLAILPGFIDCHSHSSLLKGFSENMALPEWLPVYQREHQVLTPDDAYYAAMISYVEALKGGTTCVVDMYRYLDHCAKAAEEIGLRVFLAPYVADVEGKTFFETLENNERLIQTHHNTQDGRTKVMVGLEHLFYCSENAYKKARGLSEKYNVFLHTHSSENKDEVESVIEHFGCRPIELLEKYGALTPKTIIAHAVWLNDHELDLLVKYQTSIAHCPISNAKLGGGSARIPAIRERNIKFGLGSDGTISNNSLSMWEGMKYGSLFQKNQLSDPVILSAREMIRMATIDGARLLGCDETIGSLEVGKRADFMTVNLWQPHLFPLVHEEENPILWNLVFSGRASDVTNVWIDGRRVVTDQKITFIHEEKMLIDVQEQTIDLINRRRKTKVTSFT